MSQTASAPPTPLERCTGCELCESVRSFDRRLEQVTTVVNELDARFDALGREMSAAFREMGEQNRVLLERMEQAVERFAAIERAILGE